MKKYLAVILAVMLLLTMLSACKNADEGKNDTSDPAINQNDDTKNDTQGGDPTGDDKNDTTEPEPTVDENDNNDDNNDTTDLTIQMTENYALTDPTDLEFAARYVVCADENSPSVANVKGMVAMYDVFYADADEAPVANYKYQVFDTAENAKEFADSRAALGFVVAIVEEDPCVMYITNDVEKIAENISLYVEWEEIEEATVSAYVAYYADMLGATVQ